MQTSHHQMQLLVKFACNMHPHFLPFLPPFPGSLPLTAARVEGGSWNSVNAGSMGLVTGGGVVVGGRTVYVICGWGGGMGACHIMPCWPCSVRAALKGS